MKRSSYRDLVFWEKAVHFCPKIYKLTHTFPDSEKFGLCSQLQRASVSIPTNIAEGQARSSNADFVRFLYISLGSVQEIETLLLIASHLGYISDVSEFENETQEITKMLVALISAISPKST